MSRWFVIQLFIAKLCLSLAGSVAAEDYTSMLDPVEGEPKLETKERVIPIFETRESCATYIHDNFGLVKDFEYWLWFQRFAFTFGNNAIKCGDNDTQCIAYFFLNIWSKPEGGGCNLVSTPFWKSEGLPTLKKQLDNLDNGLASLEIYSYGIQCDYQKGQMPFEGHCELLKERY